jgi:CFEM domain
MPLLVTGCTEDVAIRTAYAVRYPRIVEQDGKLKPLFFFLSSLPRIFLPIKELNFNFLDSQPRFGTCSSLTADTSSSITSSKTSHSSSALTTSGPTTKSGPTATGGPATTTSRKTSSSTVQTSIPTTTSSPSTLFPDEASLPACGQLCFNNMLAQYSALGCNALDSYCLCNNVNFGYGI